MALSNAERQARYLQRLKRPGEHYVVVNIADQSFSDQSVRTLMTALPIMPSVGDTIILLDGDGEWTAMVKSRVIRETDSEAPKLILHCEGTFRKSDYNGV